MGMYDYLNNITKSIDNQTTAQETKSNKKFKIENNLLVKLEYFIKHYKTKNKNIYNVNIQDEIIQKALYSCFGDLESQHDYKNIEDYVNNYQTKENRIDEDYYYLFCMKNYLKCCRNVEALMKKSNELTNNDYKKQIAIEKWDLQKQIMQQKLNEKSQKEAEKIKTLQRKMNQDIIFFIIKIFLWFVIGVLILSIAPVAIAFWFGLGLIKGLAK